MSEIEKMQKYIDRTSLPLPDYYFINTPEVLELGQKAKESDVALLQVIGLAFRYGKAKGYRAAKAEARA